MLLQCRPSNCIINWCTVDITWARRNYIFYFKCKWLLLRVGVRTLKESIPIFKLSFLFSFIIIKEKIEAIREKYVQKVMLFIKCPFTRENISGFWTKMWYFGVSSIIIYYFFMYSFLQFLFYSIWTYTILIMYLLNL